MHAAFTKNGMKLELHAVLLLDALLDPLAQRDHRRHVDLVERREMRRRVLRLEQMFGDALAARRHLLARLARAVRGDGALRGGRRRRRRRGGFAAPAARRGAAAPLVDALDHVRLAHDAAASRALDRTEVDALSAATRCAAGDARTSPAGADGAGRRRAAASRLPARARCGASALAAGAGGAARLPQRLAATSSISPSSSSTFTTSPSCVRALRQHAAAQRRHLDRDLVRLELDERVAGGDRSPSFFSQRDTVASTIDSPSGGTLIAVMMADVMERRCDAQ